MAKDNRIPPYQMSYDEAKRRNALPVPAVQYGNPGAGGVYNHWDEVTLNPPPGAVYATIDLLYQPTSWEYIQFLYLANHGQNAFLANEGINLLDAWLNTNQASPYVMASTTWGTPPTPAQPTISEVSLLTYSVDKRGNLVAPSDTFKPGDSIGFEAIVAGSDNPVDLSGAQVFVDISDSIGNLVTSIQGFADNTGLAVLKWKTSRKQAAGSYTGSVTEIIKSGYEYKPSPPTDPIIASFNIQ